MGRISPRAQGDIGELAAMHWLAHNGARVFIPVGHSPDIDLIADFGHRLSRVQVKTSSVYVNRRWAVMLATRGGNQSWGGIVKRFDVDRCDDLFVLVADGRSWFIPAAQVDGGTGINLGGPKYAPFEVERGRPFAVRTAA